MNEEYNKYTKESVVTRPELMKAKISSIETKKAKEIFVTKEGEVKADKPEEDILVITVKNDEFGFENSYNLKKYRSDSVPEASQLGKFLTKYGGLIIGFEVSVLKNSKGYYELVLN